jgi:molecular chaperone DnaJ
MSRRDYYEVLGVSHDASEDDIKKAFRRRARELHPDVNPGDADAEARFREAAEAYETLSDPESRGLYDRFGHEGVRGGAGGGPQFTDFGSFQDLFDAFFGGDPFAGQARQRAGEDVGVMMDITFEESATGVAREIELDVVAPCDSCEGTGAAPGAGLERCEACGGQGQIRDVARGPFGQFLRTQVCAECSGRGERPSKRCAECVGQGRRERRRTVAINIPPGIADGQQIRLAGRGHAGQPGATPGDLYVQVGVVPDERFERRGLDVIHVVTVPVTDAMLGASLSVPTVGGEAEVELRPGTQHGEEMVLRGKGFPAVQGRGRGDQRVVVDVRVPRVDDDEGRRAVEQLAAQLTDHSYREDEGFFERLKHAFR